MKILIFLIILLFTGLVTPKFCPLELPVPPGPNDLRVPCNTTLHPTGTVGDPPCFYSNCHEKGGNTSVICGCVDFDAYGFGGGMLWDCLHSTCDCPPSSTHEGDGCDIDGGDFLDNRFMGDWLVAGHPGCTLFDSYNEKQKNCLCHPVLGDGDPLSEWAWQCNFEHEFRTIPVNNATKTNVVMMGLMIVSCIVIFLWS